MSSWNFALCLEDTRSGRSVKPGCQEINSQRPLCNKGNLIRGASAIPVDFSKLSSVSGQKCGEMLGEPVCVCGFEKTPLAGKLIDVGYSVRPLMDCIELLSTRQLVYSRMVSLIFIYKFLTALVTGRKVPAGAQLPCLPDDVSKAESLQSSFERHE